MDNARPRIDINRFLAKCHSKLTGIYGYRCRVEQFLLESRRRIFKWLQRNRIDELAVGPSTTNEGKRKHTKRTICLEARMKLMMKVKEQ